MGFQDQLFQIRFSAKQMERLHKKALSDANKEKKKIKKMMEKNNRDAASIHAQNVIRHQNEAQKYLQLSARLDAVHSRLQAVSTQGLVFKNMEKITKTLNAAVNAMNPERVSSVMDQFEEAFDDITISGETMGTALDSQTSSSVPQSAVDTLIDDMMTEQQINQGSTIGSLGANGVLGNNAPVEEDTVDLQALNARFNNLNS
eukprot:TRINITY_DN2815_c0_g1_i1.p1 TRINITY_DN2815_c0_g1~~TRINITY_DN2815_c0_g1_i1.p1  ORF type:complete len:211 (+),score=75.06 TRINITY_DN2815_c0_g1_i1:28-633(+)